MNFPYKIVDLTHSLSHDIPTWDGGCGFEHILKVDYDDCTTDVKFRVQQLSMNAGIGTHMDAPAHCIPGGATIDQLDLQNLAAPCVVIDVSQNAHERYTVSVADIHAFEKNCGAIKPGSFVIIRTGWDKFWQQPERYRNNHVFPSISLEAAQLLASLQIVGLGIDTLSPDRPEDGYPVHATILGAGKYIVENIANASELPPVGSFSLALPIKIADGTEAPIRLIALVDEDKS
ncbi:MAG: cyclase family protein [Alphaproteobacteria bacterium]|nr:cyclase family protein [Alphaproteobacteria bacterium]